MGQDDPPNYDAATLVAVPLDGLDPLKNLAAFQVRFSAYATFADARVAFVSRDRLSTGAATEGDARGGAQHGLYRLRGRKQV